MLCKKQYQTFIHAKVNDIYKQHKQKNNSRSFNLLKSIFQKNG